MGDINKKANYVTDIDNSDFKETAYFVMRERLR